VFMIRKEFMNRANLCRLRERRKERVWYWFLTCHKISRFLPMKIYLEKKGKPPGSTACMRKIAASVLLKLFINGKMPYHWRSLKHKLNYVFKCKQLQSMMSERHDIHTLKLFPGAFSRLREQGNTLIWLW